jgi:hypothetical protein
MQIASLDQLPGRSDYNCPACHRERRLTVWATDTAAQRPPRSEAALAIAFVLVEAALPDGPF